MTWVYVSLAAAAGLAAGCLAMYVFARRALRQARKLTERSRKREHLLELGTLTGGLAHEIKNPLSTIKLNLKLLEEEFSAGAADSDASRRNVNRLHRLGDEVQRLHNILDDFLHFAGNLELHPVEADLRRVVEELVDFFRPQAQHNHVVLRFVLPAGPVVCRVDVGLIKQAALNLIINATQAMSAAGGELLLRLSTQDGQAKLEVIDTGPGMTPEVKVRIFQAYYTTRPGGTGLGLLTTRRIIRLHEGDIDVQSEPGKGTCFTVRLPLAEMARTGV